VYKNTHLGNGNVHMHLKGLEMNYCNESYHWHTLLENDFFLFYMLRVIWMNL
jgi:hypothetical protein